MTGLEVSIPKVVSGMTLRIRVRGMARFRRRMIIAKWLFWAAAKVLGTKVDGTIDIARDGDQAQA